MDVAPVYLAAGANRQTAGADWGDDGTLCFGGGSNLAVWRPEVRSPPPQSLVLFRPP